jgi:hypothetical protein
MSYFFPVDAAALLILGALFVALGEPAHVASREA